MDDNEFPQRHICIGALVGVPVRFWFDGFRLSFFEEDLAGAVELGLLEDYYRRTTEEDRDCPRIAGSLWDYSHKSQDWKTLFEIFHTPTGHIADSFGVVGLVGLRNDGNCGGVLLDTEPLHFGFDGFYFFVDHPEREFKELLVASGPGGGVFLRPGDCPFMEGKWYVADKDQGFAPLLMGIPNLKGESRTGILHLDPLAERWKGRDMTAFTGVIEGSHCRALVGVPAEVDTAEPELVLLDTDGFAVHSDIPKLFPDQFIPGECPPIYGGFVVPGEGEGEGYDWQFLGGWKMTQAPSSDKLEPLSRRHCMGWRRR